jgi:hypothetical protein
MTVKEERAMLSMMSKTAQPTPMLAAAPEETPLGIVDPWVLTAIKVGALVDVEAVTVCIELVEVVEVDEADEARE